MRVARTAARSPAVVTHAAPEVRARPSVSWPRLVIRYTPRLGGVSSARTALTEHPDLRCVGGFLRLGQLVQVDDLAGHHAAALPRRCGERSGQVEGISRE